MTRTWHILTSEYPPDCGGVADYTRQVAEALVQEGEDVHVWCPPAAGPREPSGVHIHTDLGRAGTSDLRALADALDRFPAPRRLLIQWVPHGYGYRSMNLWLCLWLRRRAAKGDSVELMVHEPFIDMKRCRLRHLPIAVVHRVMTLMLMTAAARVWVAVPAWESRLRPYALGRRLRIDWLPVPACISSPDDSSGSIRERYAAVGQPLIGHFGTYSDHVSALLGESLASIMNGRAFPSLLLIGRGSVAFRDELLTRHPDWRSRVHATGYVHPSKLTRHLRACDLFLQPYPDGITSRRTTVMACLALGLPVVTTSGHLTEGIWQESGAVALAPVVDSNALASAVLRLLENPDERTRVGRRGLQLYRDRFTVSTVTATLRGASAGAV